MPARRRLPKARAHRITDDAIAAWKAGDSMALHVALGLRPWELSPLDVNDGPSPWPAGSGGHSAWPQAQELQRELRRVAGEPGR